MCHSQDRIGPLRAAQMKPLFRISDIQTLQLPFYPTKSFPWMQKCFYGFARDARHRCLESFSTTNPTDSNELLFSQHVGMVNQNMSAKTLYFYKNRNVFHSLWNSCINQETV